MIWSFYQIMPKGPYHGTCPSNCEGQPYMLNDMKFFLFHKKDLS